MALVRTCDDKLMVDRSTELWSRARSALETGPLI
jgi:hypothetical protein